MRTSMLLWALAVAATLPARAAVAGETLVFFGTHSQGTGRGLSVAHFDSATGALGAPRLVVEAAAPSFFVIQADGRHLYTCNSVETFDGQAGGAVSAYAVDRATGALTLLNSALTGGGEPAHLSLDATGRSLFVANYNGGSVAAFAILPDGRLGARTALIQHEGKSVNPDRQTKPHAHCIKPDPSNRFVLAADLGVDKVFVYRFNPADSSLRANDPPFASLPAGSGPRHLTFHPNGRLAYVVNELASTVTAFTWDATRGSLTELQTVSTLPDGFRGASTGAEIEVHPSGRFLYTTNRGHDSVAVFAIDAATGRLTPIEHVSTRGRTPRNFAFDPEGRWLIATNHGSDNAAVFSVDPTTGRLTPVGEPLPIQNPFCVRFLAVR
jgi:6-phosphogluconolactonase